MGFKAEYPVSFSHLHPCNIGGPHLLTVNVQVFFLKSGLSALYALAPDAYLTISLSPYTKALNSLETAAGEVR